MASASSVGGVRLDKPAFNIADKASLQRGGKYFINYCTGCHSLQYIRYERVAEGLGLLNADNQAAVDVVMKNLIFTSAKITDPILNAIPTEEVKEWFGIVPPDLSLSARERGASWIYTYLRSFYQDENRPFGTNNLLYPDVAMPNILEPLQGIQVPIIRDEAVHGAKSHGKIPVIEQLKIETPGTLTPREFDQLVTDIVNFLSYVSEPAKVERYRIGVWVLLFFTIFLVLAYLVKKEYWRDID